MYNLYKLFSKDWSGKVKTKWTPPEGFFKQSAVKIANGLKANSSSRRQATSRLNFYINRAGHNLSDKDKSRLELAKKKLASLYDKNFSLRPSVLNYLKNAVRMPFLSSLYYGKLDDFKISSLKILLFKALDYIHNKYDIQPRVEISDKFDALKDFVAYTRYNEKTNSWMISFNKDYKFTRTYNLKTILMHELAHVIYGSLYDRAPYKRNYKSHNERFQEIAEDLYNKFNCPVEMTYYKDNEAFYGLFNLRIRRFRLHKILFDRWILMVRNNSEELHKMGAKEFYRYLSYTRSTSELELWCFNTYVMDQIDRKNNTLFGIPVFNVGSTVGIWFGIKTKNDWSSLLNELSSLVGTKIKYVLEN